LLAALLPGFIGAARAAKAPAVIKIGTLYASSGTFPAISMPVYDGLKLWVDEMNAKGGAYVKPYHKKIPIKLIAYDDQSNTATAATLYNELITQDKVDILVADSGSVLTSVAVPIARNHKMLLIDQTGTGPTFFSKDNPYIVLIDTPVSNVWPKYIPDFLTTDGVKLGVKRIAMLYSTNDFTGGQAIAIRGFFRAAKAPVKIVYFHGVPTSTSSYTVLINNIRAANPDAVIELGYPNNDIAYLRALEDSGVEFKWQFAVYPGIEPELLMKTVGLNGLKGVFTYVPSSVLEYKTGFGMSLPQYRRAWDKKYGESKIAFGFNSVAGYTTGLVLQKALATTKSMRQLALRKAIFAQSGKLKTIDGTFKLNAEGAQIGEITPLGQIEANGKGGEKFVIVYPHALATGKPVYPAK
jgi:branched-chain amino acid transport system substrate-binding protein